MLPNQPAELPKESQHNPHGQLAPSTVNHFAQAFLRVAY